MNDFAEKVSKASVALGVAGAVLAQVRRTNRIRERDTSARYGWGVRARERRRARGDSSDVEGTFVGRRKLPATPTATRGARADGVDVATTRVRAIVKRPVSREISGLTNV